MRVLLGLGGNTGDVAAAFAHAAEVLARRGKLLAASGIWRSAPIGPPQADFLNAAVIVDIEADPLRLLAVCEALEAAAGRERRHEPRHGPRPLDIDLLLAPGVVVDGPALTLPHPRLAERRFALLPAAEIAPEWRHPRLHRSLAELAAALAAEPQRCERVGAFPALG